MPENAKILLLGSFPPPRKRWCMGFYYPNFQNDMWRIFGLVFFKDKNFFLDGALRKFNEEKLRAFLSEKGVALFDAAYKVRRANADASDAFLEIVERTDLNKILAAIPSCLRIAATGKKALETVADSVGAPLPELGGFSEFEFDGRRMELWRMPSSSRAYPMSLENKAEYYAAMFRRAGLV